MDTLKGMYGVPLAALRAGVGARARVRAHVQREAVRHAERLAADAARVRLLACDRTLHFIIVLFNSFRILSIFLC